MIEVADILRQHGQEYARTHPLLPSQAKLVQDLERCRTPACGGVRCDPQLGQTFVFAARLPTLASGRHPGKLVDGHSRDYPGGFVWKEPGRGGSGAVRFEPVAPVTSRRSQDHPPWLELQFNAVVP